MPVTSQTGTIMEAVARQLANNVQERFRGAWFHVSQDPDIEQFTDEFEDWTFFTRSPLGGAIWGQTVLQVYLVEPATDCRVHAAGEGDTLAQEGNRRLPDWWLFVGREDIGRLMVVRKYQLTHDEAIAIELRDAAEFQALGRCGRGGAFSPRVDTPADADGCRPEGPRPTASVNGVGARGQATLRRADHVPSPWTNRGASGIFQGRARTDRSTRSVQGLFWVSHCYGAWRGKRRNPVG